MDNTRIILVGQRSREMQLPGRLDEDEEGYFEFAVVGHFLISFKGRIIDTDVLAT